MSIFSGSTWSMTSDALRAKAFYPDENTTLNCAVRVVLIDERWPDSSDYNVAPLLRGAEVVGDVNPDDALEFVLRNDGELHAHRDVDVVDQQE